MNLIHRVYCRSRIWRAHVRALLPWALDGISLERSAVLELGPGPGLTTDWLVPRLGSLTCVEYDEADASALARRHPGVVVRRGDATALPFESGSFDAMVCFTMLHHLPSATAQDPVRRGRPGLAPEWRVCGLGQPLGSHLRAGTHRRHLHLGRPGSTTGTAGGWWLRSCRDRHPTGRVPVPGACRLTTTPDPAAARPSWRPALGRIARAG